MPLDSVVLQNQIPIRFILPIVLQYKEKDQEIQIIQSPSSSVMEGKSLDIQPKLKLTDSNRNPITGIMCFATLEGINNFNFLGGLNIARDLFLPKYLFKQVSGQYKDCQLKTNGSCFTPVYTD